VSRTLDWSWATSLTSSSRLATCSPDLTACDNALWGFIKSIVAQERYDTIDELKDTVRRAFQQITPAMLSPRRAKTDQQRWTIIQPEWKYRLVSTMNLPVHTCGVTVRTSSRKTRPFLGYGHQQFNDIYTMFYGWKASFHILAE
ncbi:hypothetical protein ANN_20097, partial [Periplaneta americana]